MALQLVKPGDLPVATSVDTVAALVVQNGEAVEQATPAQIVSAGRPIATEVEAVTGTDNTKSMTPLTVRQAINADTSGSVAQAIAAADAAEASALDAESAEEQTGIDALATASDRVQTGIDAAATAADRVQTGLDVIATSADATATAADRVQTGLDVTATGADATATAADRVQTGLDAAATAADRVQTGLDAAAASDSADAAALSAATLTYASQAEAEAGTASDRVISPLSLRQALRASGSAPIYAARAWVNFNGTGTVAIRASGNVSSITDNGTGDYTVNFTTAMQDANFATVVTVGDGASVGSGGVNNIITTASTVRIITFQTGAGAVVDAGRVSVAVFR